MADLRKMRRFIPPHFRKEAHMTTLIYVRHGEAEGNLKRHFHGFYNSALTPNGRRQIKLSLIHI